MDFSRICGKKFDSRKRTRDACPECYKKKRVQNKEVQHD